MRVVLNETVLEAAKRRIRWLFDEFPRVVVNVSGGKDSTVCYYLALEVARELDRLPIGAMWIDEEVEWQATVDLVTTWMEHPDVEPIWLQIPFRIANATSHHQHFLKAWDPEAREQWMHPQHPLAQTENVYGVDRYSDLFEASMAYHYDGEKVARLSGVRAEESAGRLMGITGQETYGGETWGNKRGADKGQQHYTFFPIYDWSYTDVWKYIYDLGVPYNRIYDLQYRYGVRVRHMRISNLVHEMATSMFYMEEFEPETYARLTRRMVGPDMAGKLGEDDYFVWSLPHMFSGWEEYRDYLLEHLIVREDWRDRMGVLFRSQQARLDPSWHPAMFRQHVLAVLANDFEGRRLTNFEATTAALRTRRKRGSAEDAS